MKKTIILLGICSVILACNSSNTTSSTEDTTSISQDAGTQSGMDTSTAAAPADAAGSSQTPAATPAPETPKAGETNASTAKGQELISKSGCLACHKVSEKLVGPAYTAVATKYDDTEANLDYLAGKIIAGGSGVWGDIPMTPHPALSKDDAKEMARYVLSLK